MYLFIRIERYPGPVSPGPSEIRTDFRCHAYHKSEPFSATNVLQIPYGCKNSVKIGLRSAMGHRNALSLFRAAYRPTQRHRKRFMKREIFPTLLVSVLCLLAACTGTGDGQEPVRNIIFMIGDGMGLPQVTALSLEQGYAPPGWSGRHTRASRNLLRRRAHHRFGSGRYSTRLRRKDDQRNDRHDAQRPPPRIGTEKGAAGRQSDGNRRDMCRHGCDARRFRRP